MRTTHALMAVAIIAGTLLPAGPAMAELRVWTTAQTEHVLRSAPPGGGLAVSVSAAKNQWRSFQVLLRADRPVKGVNLKAGELRGPQGAVLDVHRARLYRQHQLHLNVGTYRNDRFQPDWYPDPLIPFEHPLPGGTLEAGAVRGRAFRSARRGNARVLGRSIGARRTPCRASTMAYIGSRPKASPPWRFPSR